MVSVEAFVAVAAGLLATTMAPCLMQVVVFYFFAISGMTLSEVEEGNVSQTQLRSYKRKLMLLTGAFSVGILIVFTGFGYLVGILGSEMRNIPLFTGNAVMAQRIAGVGFIVLGVWMANVTRTPIVCKIPFPTFRKNPEDLGYLGMFAMGFTFMFGCASCFSGAIFGVLIVFIGASSAPLQAGMVMFFFGLGVVIPLMIASYILTEVIPLVQNLKKWSRRFGAVSSLIMILFGLASLFGHFHTLTDWIWYQFYYPEGSVSSILPLIAIPATGRGKLSKLKRSRRRFLSTASLALGLGSAGCLTEDSDRPDSGSMGNATAGTGNSDESGDSNMVYVSGDILEITITGPDEVTPTAVRAATGARIAVTVQNDGNEQHGIRGAEAGLSKVVIDPGTLETVLWNVTETPGTYRASCPVHGTELMTLDVVPADASSGCPSG